MSVLFKFNPREYFDHLPPKKFLLKNKMKIFDPATSSF